jgi:hypothetical protein
VSKLPTFRHAGTGITMTAHDLPDPTKIKRWTAFLKATVLDAIRVGAVSAEHVQKTYNVSDEELEGWARRYRQDGIPGLRTWSR